MGNQELSQIMHEMGMNSPPELRTARINELNGLGGGRKTGI